MSAASATQLAQWAASAGFAGQDQAVAVAVALATGGDPEAPYGAWGIGGTGTGADQAVAARQRFNNSGWATFPSHQTGGWMFYMPTASLVVQPTPAPQSSSGEGIGGFVQKVESIPGKVVSGLAGSNIPVLSDAAAGLEFIENPDTWKRVAKLGIGVMLLGIAFFKFGFDNIVTGPVRVLSGTGGEVAHHVSNLFIAKKAAVAAEVASSAKRQQDRQQQQQQRQRPRTRAQTPRERNATTRPGQRPAPPKPESERVRQAKEILRNVDRQKREEGRNG